MKPQRKVGNDDSAGLGTAECDLVVRLGIRARRVQTDDRQPLGRAAPQVLAAKFDRPADDRDVDARPGQQVIQIIRTRNELQARFRKARKRGQRARWSSSFEKPVSPFELFVAVTENHNVHRDTVSPAV